jgi:hypothetical protein
VRRAVFLFALIFVLALGVSFSARNVGLAQRQDCQKVNGSLESLPQPPYEDPSTDDPNDRLPREPGMRPPKEIRKSPVCHIRGDERPNRRIMGTDNVNMVDLIEGKGGSDTLRGRGGWNGLIGGTGEDTIKGGPDRDIIFAIDAVKQTGRGENAQVEIDPNISPQVDTIQCGLGTDTVYADHNPDGTLLDEVDNLSCEDVQESEPDIPVPHWWRRSRK